jgi:hypothetical protein
MRGGVAPHGPHYNATLRISPTLVRKGPEQPSLCPLEARREQSAGSIPAVSTSPTTSERTEAKRRKQREVAARTDAKPSHATVATPSGQRSTVRVHCPRSRESSQTPLRRSRFLPAKQQYDTRPSSVPLPFQLDSDAPGDLADVLEGQHADKKDVMLTKKGLVPMSVPSGQLWIPPGTVENKPVTEGI